MPQTVIIDASVSRPTRHRLSSVQLIALGFLSVILVGTLLLCLPVSQQPGVSVGVLDCLFTATSATCVTGLVTVSTAESWTRFGQIVILLLIQVGALGYMTLATVIAMALGLRIGIRARLALRESHGLVRLHDATQLLRVIAIGTLLIEGIGALLLMLRFHFYHGYTWGHALYEGIFYSVSGFCNAGFDLAPGFLGLSFPAFRTDIGLLIILGILIILGGIGFGVLLEVGHIFQKSRLSLHSKLALSMSGILILTGMVLFLFFEWRSEATLGALDNVWQRLTTAWFMSVTPRTAGFSPVDLTAVSPPTLFWLGMLMVIGASPDSTGGGIKTTTVAIIILAIITLIRNRRDIEAYRRRISGELVRLALSLTSIYLLAAFLVVLGISFTEITLPNVHHGDTAMARYGDLMFEVFSAFGTVGLSAGITPTLAPVSRILIILAMFIGRLGPLTFFYVFARQWNSPLRRLPEEPVVVG